MNSYKVKVSIDGKNDLRRYISYLVINKKSKQAATSVMDDFTETRTILADVAESLAKPESEELLKRGLKRINFQRHNYFCLYKIEDDKAIITNIFHGREDFENKLS